MDDRIRSLRVQRGWSQAELAERAGVTRQLVSTVEAGRHQPNVTAALRLATALDTSVEELFGDPAPGVAAVGLFADSAPETDGGVAVARVGEQLVWVPVREGGEHPESWGVADALRSGEHLTWLPGGRPAELLLVGCDPLLGLISTLAGRSGRRVLTAHASTGRSIAALAAGHAHGVLVHARPGDLPAPPVAVRRWRVARWAVGLATAPGRSSALTVEEVAERRPVIIQRDAGAGSQQALVRALRAAGADATTRLPGPIGEGHLDVARRLAHGAGEAGVAMEAAAHAFGLGFLPLERHEVELWIAADWADLPAARAVVEQLGDPALHARSRLLRGYDLTASGTALDAG